jgi:hypothetical protein
MVRYDAGLHLWVWFVRILEERLMYANDDVYVRRIETGILWLCWAGRQSCIVGYV